MHYSNDPINSLDPRTTDTWAKLVALAKAAKQTTLAKYFADDTSRYNSFNFKAAGLSANISRQHIDKNIFEQLIALANEMHLAEAIPALFSGQLVNFTEQRAALHTDLRTPNSTTVQQQLAHDCRAKMQGICEQLHSQAWRGHNGEAITDIVSIGIGGSDLGPRMVTEALTPYHSQQLKLHFVTNIDPCDLENTLAPLRASSTLFVVTSKSWNTLETLTNAESAKQWFIAQTGQTDINQHFIAISTNIERCTHFGINPEHILPLWDWVGGRFSLWSAVGLPIALATSFEHFEALLAGAYEMDQHFQHAPLAANLPVILALLEVWYVNFWGCTNVAVLPYDHTLRLLPNHLQQLTMESNGKSIDRNGQALSYSSAPVLWGSAGTIGQHSFHQLLHQGTQMIPVDFILPLHSHSKNQAQHDHMIANCLAQAQTLMDGQTVAQAEQILLSQGLSAEQAQLLAEHKTMPANRPSSIISFHKLTPNTLGALIALYEHKTYASSIIWNINAFDQWGVELGKTASTGIYTSIQQATTHSENSATQAALNEIFKQL